LRPLNTNERAALSLDVTPAAEQARQPDARAARDWRVQRPGRFVIRLRQMHAVWRREQCRSGSRGDRQQSTENVDQQGSGARRGTRAVAFALVVALAAVAFTTLLRPRNGYTSTDRLLVVLGLGAAAAVGGLIIAGAAANLRRRGGDRSFWPAMTSPPSMGVVLGLFIAAAAASQLLQAVRPASGTNSAPAATRADFRRWQAAAVPIMVQWMQAIRNDGVFAHGFPPGAPNRFRRPVDRSRRTLARLARSLAADAPQLPQRSDLRRLTRQLERALAVARRGQRNYALALDVASPASRIRARQRALIGRLVDRGNKDIQRSLAIMTGVSFDANKLGASLFVEQP
jgi:hypothetical protein